MPVTGSYSQRRSLRSVKRLPRTSGLRWASQATPLHNRGMTLVELLIVLAIIAVVAGIVTFSVSNTLKRQRAKTCLTNMLMIEAAKDEFVRDHPDALSGNADQIANYLRFGLPKCPTNPNGVYNNWNSIGQETSCPIHGAIEALKNGQ
jgi:prepilin-type N-terminal cleavage/methylation domain-containing protein